jgi:hypothetical protein
MADTAIFVRSPYIVTQSGTANDAIRAELFLWNDPDSIPSTATYTLSKPIPSSLITQVHFDISPYCREYISHSTFTEVTADTTAPVGEYCYCYVKVYKNGVLQTGGGSYTAELIAFDGFSWYEDGYNTGYVKGFLNDGTYYVSDTGGCGGVYYHDDQAVTWTAVYVGLTTGGAGTTITLGETVGYIPYVHSSYVGEGNTLTIKRDGVTVSTYRFEEICEGKFTVLDCDFVNKYGAWQRLVFFKASSESMEMSNTEYFLMPSNINYTVTDNRKQVFNVNGQRSIKCNTGWVPEAYKEVIKELMMSERILIDNEPVKLKTKSTQLFKHLNDNNINYELEFEYSHNMLNYVI